MIEYMFCHLLTNQNSFGCHGNPCQPLYYGCFGNLLPLRPPSLTYLDLGVMLEPYTRHIVKVSGYRRRVGRRHFVVHLLFL